MKSWNNIQHSNVPMLHPSDTNDVSMSIQSIHSTLPIPSSNLTHSVSSTLPTTLPIPSISSTPSVPSIPSTLSIPSALPTLSTLQTVCDTDTIREELQNNTHKLTEAPDTSTECECCAICQENIANTANIDTLRVLECKHVFHAECINPWIEQRNLCPICRQVADKTQPVRSANNDDIEATRRLVMSLISSTNNRRSRGFWSLMLGDGGGVSVQLPNSRYSNSSTSQTLTNLLQSITRRLPSSTLLPSSSSTLLSDTSSPYDYNYENLDEMGQCSGCYKVLSINCLKQCSQCKATRYCSVRCQKNHWNDHREWCVHHVHQS